MVFGNYILQMYGTEHTQEGRGSSLRGSGGEDLGEEWAVEGVSLSGMLAVGGLSWEAW